MFAFCFLIVRLYEISREKVTYLTILGQMESNYHQFLQNSHARMTNNPYIVIAQQFLSIISHKLG